ncbi:hypothetical protein [Microcystis phage Mae-JY35]
MKALAVIGLLLLTGCQTSQGTFCDIAKPVRLTSVQIENLTDAQVSDILGHNRRGQKLCGWVP